ncbi:EamA family transporter [Micromonospora zamorensis]
MTLPAGGLTTIEIDPKTLIAVVILDVVATGITFHLTYRIIAAESATNTATVGYLLPVVSVALGAIVLDEDLSLRIATGMVVVLVGVGLTRSRKPRPSTLAPEATPGGADRTTNLTRPSFPRPPASRPDRSSRSALPTPPTTMRGTTPRAQRGAARVATREAGHERAGGARRAGAVIAPTVTTRLASSSKPRARCSSAH